ncbi:MAG TPA: hypothetical protein VF524_06460 [Polyangia bacterium]
MTILVSSLTLGGGVALGGGAAVVVVACVVVGGNGFEPAVCKAVPPPAHEAR